MAKQSAKLFFVLAICAGLAAAQIPKKTAKSIRKGTAVPVAHRVKTAKAADPPNAALVSVQPAAGHRDPFTALITEHKPETGHENLPPGKAGLVISTLRVDGTVRSGDSMIAVLSNPDERVYFVREGDRLFDGDVEKIGLDGVTFQENSKDAFGKPIERTVTKRIYASAGDQQ